MSSHSNEPWAPEQTRQLRQRELTQTASSTENISLSRKLQKVCFAFRNKKCSLRKSQITAQKHHEKLPTSSFPSVMQTWGTGMNHGPSKCFFRKGGRKSQTPLQDHTALTTQILTHAVTAGVLPPPPARKVGKEASEHRAEMNLLLH